MPELPEVETIRRDLVREVRDRVINEAWISPNAPRLVQLMPPEAFTRQIAGRSIVDLDRRGKYLLIRLDGPDGQAGLTWAVHLRMTGRLFHSASPCAEDPYLRARFHLDDGNWLCFVDLRKFGTMWLVDDESLVTSKLGPEPLAEEFTPAVLRGILAGRAAPVKAVLMDQASIAGLGNIYADEALFAARVRPQRAANTLSKAAVQRLHTAIRDVLLDALGDRGSSFRDYVDGRGNEGMHQLKVKVFRRTDEPCYACGTPIRRLKVGGRSTHYCPRCQR